MTFEEELSKLKEDVDIVDVIDNFTPLHKKGRYHEGLCIFHNDTSVGSFKVDSHKQLYKCYACGSGGDVIDFLTNAGKTFKEAVEILKKDISNVTLGVKKPKIKVELADFKYIRKKEGISPEKFLHSKFGEPTNVYTYRDADGDLVGYVLRYLKPDGHKQILPYNWATCVKAGWEYEYNGKGKGRYYKIGDIVSRFIGFGEMKPIYNLDRLIKNPNAKVLVVEGEKCADSVQEKFPEDKVVVICWQSGVDNVSMVDWTVLKDREVYLIPDNDYTHTDLDGVLKNYYEQPSPKAFNHIKNEIVGYTSELYWVKPFRVIDYPDGWDLADTDWNVSEIFNFIQKNKRKIEKKFGD